MDKAAINRARHEAYPRDFNVVTQPSTRDLIREFNLAFKRPVNESLVNLTVSDRELLGKLLLEETIETLTKGLGLSITYASPRGITHVINNMDAISCRLNEGQRYDPIETSDGIGDVNVVIHFMAHWMGVDLDAVTREINDSNMSKLGEDGEPIINGVTPGYRGPNLDSDSCVDMASESRFDPSKPVGKILKGPNYREPDIAAVIGLGDAVSIMLQSED